MTKQIPTFSASIAVALAMCLSCGGDKAAEPSSDGSKAAAKAIRGVGSPDSPDTPKASQSALPAEIGDLELNISLYLQPDGTGSKTHNKFLQLKEGRRGVTYYASIQ